MDTSRFGPPIRTFKSLNGTVTVHASDGERPIPITVTTPDYTVTFLIPTTQAFPLAVSLSRTCMLHFPGLPVLFSARQAQRLARTLRAHHVPELHTEQHLPDPRYPASALLSWHVTGPSGAIMSDEDLLSNIPASGLPVTLMARRLWKVSLMDATTYPQHRRIERETGATRKRTASEVREERAAGWYVNMRDVVHGRWSILPS